MKTTTIVSLLFILCLSSVLTSSSSLSLSSSNNTSLASSSLNSTETVFDILDRYNLPRGLLPDAIDTYTFNPSNGRLVITFRPPECIFNRAQTSWLYASRKRDAFHYIQTPFTVDLSRDRMIIRSGQRLGTVTAALDPPYTTRRQINEFWRRGLVNAQGGITDTIWIAPPAQYRIYNTEPFIQVPQCSNTQVM